MRIVAISDTHTKHHKITVPDGDVLIHAGDISGRGEPWEIARFDRWLRDLPHRHKIVIAGNHDLNFEDFPDKRWIFNAEYLQDSYIIIDGVKFYGSPWQPEFCDWAFNLERGEALREKWALIPTDTDVLITHGPPFGILDPNMQGISVGCADLLKRVMEVRPRIHLCGHIHAGYGTLERDGIQFGNASICTEQYQPINPPLVFEV